MKNGMLVCLNIRRVLTVILIGVCWSCAVVAQGAVSFQALWVEDELCIENYPVRAVLSWEVEAANADGVEVRVGAPDGNLFSSSGLTGTAETGAWVNENTEFFLLSRPHGDVLARASVETPSCESLRVAERRRRASQLLDESADNLVRFDLSPPRLFYCGRAIERTTVRLEWDVSALEASSVEIFLTSVDGSLFVRGTSIGQAETRNWVTDGMVFVLYLPEFDLVAATREFRIRPCAEANL